MLVLGWIDVPLWCLIPSLTVVTFYIYTEILHATFWRNGIPGPKPLPFVGGFFDLIKHGSPTLFLKDSQIYGKCYGYFLGNIPVLVVTDPEIIKEVFVRRFSDFTGHANYLSANDPALKNTIIFAETYDVWRKYKTMLSPAFTAGKVKKMDGIFKTCIDDMIDLMTDKASKNIPADFNQLLNDCTMDIASRVMLGVNEKLQGNSDNPITKLLRKSMSKSTVKTFGLLALTMLCPALLRVYGWFGIELSGNVEDVLGTVTPVMDYKKNNKGKYKDILQILLDSRLEQNNGDEGKSSDDVIMTDIEILSNVMQVLLIISETAGTVVAMVFYYLAMFPECQDRIILEIDDKVGKSLPTAETLQQCEYVKMVICEAMRLHPTLTRINRHTTTAETINGYKLPKNVNIELPIYALHRSEENWQDPLKFDPERFSQKNKENIKPFTYMPFGLGPRQCIGERFAMHEMKMFVVRIMQKFRIKRWEGMDIPPKFQRNFITRLENGMPLMLEKRDN